MVRYLNGGLKTGLKKSVMGQNVQYANGPPSHVTYLLNTGHPYCSDESGIQMVTVKD